MLKNTSCIGTAGCCSDCMSWNVKPSCADCRVFWRPFTTVLPFLRTKLFNKKSKLESAFVSQPSDDVEGYEGHKHCSADLCSPIPDNI